MPAQTFDCPSCGAPLSAQPGQNEVTCSFCGSRVIVPAELRPAPTPPVQPTAAPQVIIIEQPPVVVQGQTPIPIPVPVPWPRRRRGCGCCGPIIGLLILMVLFSVFVFIQRPLFVERLLERFGAAAGQFADNPQIITFTAAQVNNRGSVVAAWVTNADSVRLDVTGPQGAQTISPLDAVGQRILAMTGPGDATFRLTVTKNGKSETRSVTVSLRR